MTLKYKSSTIPIEIGITGDIGEIDYTWRIVPLIKSIKKRNYESMFYYLRKLKNWANNKNILLKLTYPLLFKITFFLFCKIYR